MWKLNSTENFSRMRLKLSREYGGNRHRDASRLRDVGSILEIPLEPTSADTALLSLVKVATRLTLTLILATCVHVYVTMVTIPSDHSLNQKKMNFWSSSWPVRGAVRGEFRILRGEPWRGGRRW